MRTACSDGADGLILWAGTHVWCYEPRREESVIVGVRRVPFIPWPCQEAALRNLYDAIDQGHDILVDKSRDMGASWICLITLAWWFYHVPDSALLLASRVEDLVDKRGDPDSLFWKLDFIHTHLPPWYRPLIRRGQERRSMHVTNPDNGSVIDGSSTNEDLARGGRRTAIMLDEFAAVDGADAIYRSTSDVTPCRLFNSTPKGFGSWDERGHLRGNAFGAIRHSGRIRIITLHWSQHPRKGLGQYRQAEDADAPELLDGWAGPVVLEEPGRDGATIRRTVEFPDAYPFIADGKLRSPWYDAECRRRVSRRDIAENLDIDYLGSGEQFFDADVLRRIRDSGDIRPADHEGELLFELVQLSPERWRVENVRFDERPGGRLRVWGDLPHGRPRQDHNYVSFADIALGTGASNSCLRFASVNDREEVGAFVCPNTLPEELARIGVALNLWVGGQCGYCYHGWEANGVGETYGRALHRCGYPYVLGNEDSSIPWYPTDSKIGWYSSGPKKLQAFADLRGELARGAYTIHDQALLDELSQQVYIIQQGQPTVGPAEMVNEPGGARTAHGDRVVPAAGNIMCLRHQPMARPPETRPPRNSIAGAAAARRQAQQLKETGRW